MEWCLMNVHAIELASTPRRCALAVVIQVAAALKTCFGMELTVLNIAPVFTWTAW